MLLRCFAVLRILKMSFKKIFFLLDCCQVFPKICTLPLEMLLIPDKSYY